MAKKSSKRKKAATSKKSKALSWESYILIALMLSTLVLDFSNRDGFLGIRMLLFSMIGIAAAYYSYQNNIQLSISALPAKIFFGALIGFNLWTLVGLFYAAAPAETLFYLAKNGLILALLFILIILFNRKNNLLSSLTAFIILYGAIISIIGILQALDLGFLFIAGRPHPVGLSGNRNIYGAQIALLLPLLLYAYLKTKKAWKILALLAFGLAISALFFSQTRSAWLGAGVGFIIGYLLMLNQRAILPQEIWKSMRVVNMSIGAAVGTIILTIFLLAPKADLSLSIKNRLGSMLGVASETNDIASQNVSERIYMWGKTVEMIQDQPIIGVGGGNWRIIFPIYGLGTKVDPNIEYQPIRVRPHNYFLRVLSEQGIIGISFLIAIFYGIGQIARISLKHTNNSVSKLPLLVALSGLSIFIFDLLFSFSLERMETALLAVIYLAMVLSYFQKIQLQDSISNFKLSQPLSSLVLIILFAFSALFGFYRWKFDDHLFKVVAYDFQEAPYKMLEETTKGKNAIIKLGPVSDPLELQEARAHLKLKNFDQAIAASEIAEQYHPNNHRIFNTRGAAYLRSNRAKEALVHIEHALSLAPEYEPSLVNKVLCHFQLGNNEALDSALINLKVPTIYSFEDLPWKLKIRQAQESLEVRDLYHTINYVQKQLDQKATEIDLGPLVTLYNQYSSDSLFIADYISVIGDQALAEVQASKRYAPEMDQIRSNIGIARYILLTNRNNPAIIRVILENNHRTSMERLKTYEPSQFQTVKDVIAWVNERQ